MPTITELQTCELAPTSTECEFYNAKIQTQYYFQYGIELLIICSTIALWIIILSWRNWLSEIIRK